MRATTGTTVTTLFPRLLQHEPERAADVLADVDFDSLGRIEQRVLWLAVRMVDAVNREGGGPIKVGGHQASSASMVSLMTALWFCVLGPDDRVAVKPHASPVLHAIQYLIGNLDRSYLTRLRQLGGLQAYPSRTKDPDPIDFSTGSVGLGAVAPLFGAAVRRYVDAHFPETLEQRGAVGRYIALLGDAELDEGNVWEAVADPATQGLGNVLLVVDLNRQSLDRVVPGIKAARLQRMFADNGWHVVEAKYGRRLQEMFTRPGGEALRDHLDRMSNEEYQSLFAARTDLRDRFLVGADPTVKGLLADLDDTELAGVVLNLGGHDLEQLLRCFAACDAEAERPSILFAYTIKGWGLAMAGDPLNHAALLSGEQVDALRAELGLTPDDELDPFAEGSDEARWCREVGQRLRRASHPRAGAPDVPVPTAVGLPALPVTSTQGAFGRLLVGLSRIDEVRRRLVTTSPDVTVSTNLGGWVNRVGVFAPVDQPDFLGEDRLLRWKQTPLGQHIELGISEMNLFLLLGQLGLAEELCGERLLPIGTVYDPFVLRGLDALIYGLYSGSRFVVVGTPSGVTLSHEGGAHQSTITPSVGLELPGLVYAEPAYAMALDWLLCDGLASLADPVGGASLYLRLTTRPIEQAPFEEARERLGEDELRRQVLAGGYRLLETSDPAVQLVGSGAVLPEVLAAAATLADEGVATNVIDVTSLDRLHTGWAAARRGSIRAASATGDHFHLAELIPEAERRAPIVTVHDASSHAMAWLGSVFGAPVTALGVEGFGQSGSIDDLYRINDLSAEAVVNAALGTLG